LAIFSRLEASCKETPPFDATQAASIVQVLIELFDSKDNSIVRSQTSLSILLSCATSFCTSFSAVKKSKFLSPLERNTLKLLQVLPPCVEFVLVWEPTVLPACERLLSVPDEDFRQRLRAVYLELFEQAPSAVKAKQLEAALLVRPDVVSTMETTGSGE
jgi:hypothetical protein